MWKKIGIMMVALVSTFSVVFAMNQEMFGAGSSPLSNTVTLQEGSKLYIGNYEGKDVVWDVMITQSNQYLLGTSIPLVNKSAYCNLPTTANRGEFKGYPDPPDTYRSCTYGTASGNVVYSKILDFNASAFSSIEKNSMIDFSKVSGNKEVERYPAFIPTWQDLKIGGNLHVSDVKSDVTKYSNIQYDDVSVGSYWMSETAFYDNSKTSGGNTDAGSINNFTMLGMVISKASSGVPNDRWLNDQIIMDSKNKYENPFLFKSSDPTVVGSPSVISTEFVAYNKLLREQAIRPFTVLSKPNIVFGVDSSFKDNTIHKIYMTTKPGDAQTAGAMKVRVLDNTLNVTLQSSTIGGISKGGQFKISYKDATTGPKNYISAIIRDNDGNIKYYQRLELAKSGTDNEVIIDTSSMEIASDYHIQLVNEVIDDTSNLATYSSLLTDDLVFSVTSPMDRIEYNETPQISSTALAMDHLESGDNIDKKQVATAVVKLEDNTIPVHKMNYEILSPIGDSTISPFEFKQDGDGNVLTDASGKAIIYAKNDLLPGIYKFRIRAYDDFDNPKSSDKLHGIDASGNPVMDTTSGIISDEQTIIVYPNRNTITVDVNKKANSDSTLSNYTTTDINTATSPITLATAKLDPNPHAGSTPAYGAEMAITYGVKDVKLNGVNVSSGNEDFQMDIGNGKITKITGKDVIYGKHEFTVAVTYTYNGKSITIDKGVFSFYVDPDLYFVDIENPNTKISEQSVKYVYTDNTHDFEVLAKSSSTELATKIKYRVKSSDTSGTITYKSIGSGNKGIFTANKLGETIIEAYYEEGGVDIVVKELKIKIVVDALTDLIFTEKPQLKTYFSYAENTKKDDQVGIISSKFGAKPITYVVSDTTNFYLKDNTDAATKDKQKYICDANGNTIIYAKKDLDVGVYTFEIQAFDALYEPFFDDNGTHYGIDKLGNKVSGYDKGLISETYTLVVYPNKDQITYTQEKKDMGTVLDKNDDEFYTAKDINDSTNKKLGLIEFTNDAKIQALKNEGYIIDKIEFFDKGTTNLFTELKVEADATNVNKYDIKKNGTVSSGLKEFDIHVTFKKTGGSTSTALIIKADQKFYIAPDLQYVNPDKTTEFLTKKEYTKTYDPEGLANDFNLIATDNSNHLSNSNVKYCIVKNGVCDSTGNDVITLNDHLNGTSTITAKAPGTTNKVVIVRAYIEDNGVLHTTQDIKITITPAVQKLEWKGENIQSVGNNIIKDPTASEPTWELNLKYNEPGTGETIEAVNTYVEKELYKKSVYEDKTIALLTNVLDQGGGTPALVIEYEIIGSDADKANVDINGGNLVIHGKLSGTVIIKATAKATGDYGATVVVDDPNTTSINEIASATLKLTVSDKAQVEYTKAYPESYIISGDNRATGKDKLGTLSISPSTETGFSYVVKEIKTVDTTKPIGDPNRLGNCTKQLILKGSNSDELYVKDSSMDHLTKGIYQVTITASRVVNGVVEEAIEKVFEIEVKDKTMKKEDMQWSSKLDTSYSPVGGTIHSITAENSKTLEYAFKTDSIFYVKVEDIVGKTQISGTPQATIKYKVKDGSTAGIIQLEDGNSGSFKMISASNAGANVMIQATISKTGYEDMIVYLPITITQGSTELKFIKEDGTPYPTTTVGTTTTYDPISIEYKKDKSLNLFTAGAPTGSKVTITIKSKGASNGNDVLKFPENGSGVGANADTGDKVCEITADEYTTGNTTRCDVLIENALNSYFANKANKNADEGKIVVIATSSASADGNYKANSIEIPVNVKQTNQNDFAFKQSKYQVLSNINGAMSPLYENTGSSGKIALSLIKKGDNEADLSVSEAWLIKNPQGNVDFKSDYDSFGYNITVNEGDPPVEFHIYAQKDADRNYEQSPQVSALVSVEAADQELFVVTPQSYEKAGDTTPKRTITYGDDHFILNVECEADEIEVDGNGDPLYQYSYELISEYDEYVGLQPGETEVFVPKRAGTVVKIRITRTAADGSKQTMDCKFSIAKKVVKKQIADISKLAGQSVSKDEFVFTNTSTDFLDKDKAIIGNPVFSCLDSDGNIIADKDFVTVEKDNKRPITAEYPETSVNRDALSNYSITYVKASTAGIEPGSLLVTQEVSQKSWFEIKPGTQDDTTSTMKGSDNWYNGPVDVFLKPASGDYDLIGNAMDAVFDTKKFIHKIEGINNVSIYFRQSNGDKKDAISKPQSVEIKIDTTDPTITSITGTETNKDDVSKILNSLTFGKFFKPGAEISITGNDTLSGVESVDYKVYKIDETTGLPTTIVKSGKLTSFVQGVGTFKLDEVGPFRVCATSSDKATNTSKEKCSDVLVKKIDVDIDGDGKPDLNDPDGDGCPDINIVLGKDKNDKWIKLNVDRDGDKIPDLNIDSNGDGKADINIDTDNDGKPDLNLIKLKEWKPTFCVSGQAEQYCTMKDIKPVINVDVDDNGIPDIDIDNVGDFKPHLNISTDGKTASVNITRLHEWKPIHDYKKDTFVYDSIGQDEGEPFPELEIDSDNDGLPDLNIDLDKDGTPDLNIDSDYDGIPELNIDGDGDGTPDYNLEVDKNGKPTKNVIIINKWEPNLNGNKDGKEFDTMEIKTKGELEDNGVKVEKPGGTFLPNYAIKVTDAKDSISDEEKDKINAYVKDGNEIKDILDVKLYEGDSVVQPDGTLKVSLPLKNSYKGDSIKVIVEQADGTFIQVDARVEDGYLVYDTNYLGKVSIIGDKEESDGSTTTPDPDKKPTDTPDPTPTPDTDTNPNQGTGNNGSNNPSTSVKGTYISGTGGAITGDTTDILPIMISMVSAIGILFFLKKKTQKEE